jgi:hypothetical protein
MPVWPLALHLLEHAVGVPLLEDDLDPHHVSFAVRVQVEHVGDGNRRDVRGSDAVRSPEKRNNCDKLHLVHLAKGRLGIITDAMDSAGLPS